MSIIRFGELFLHGASIQFYYYNGSEEILASSVAVFIDGSEIAAISFERIS